MFTAIDNAMPALLAKHQLELTATEKLKQELNQQGGGSATGAGGRDHRDGTQSDSDDDEDNRDGTGDRHSKRIIAPRKKFEWTDKIK